MKGAKEADIVDFEELTIDERLKVARKNDGLRRGFVTSDKFKIVLTSGLMTDPRLHDVIAAVREFKDFNEDNDPHGEHDFGEVQVFGNRYFFKFDYYHKGLRNWCNPLKDECVRVLTLMKAEEY